MERRGGGSLGYKEVSVVVGTMKGIESVIGTSGRKPKLSSSTLSSDHSRKRSLTSGSKLVSLWVLQELPYCGWHGCEHVAWLARKVVSSAARQLAGDLLKVLQGFPQRQVSRGKQVATSEK